LAEGPVNFATKIILGMAAVILVAVGIVTLAGGQRVRSAYLSALQGSLDARVETVATQREIEAGQAMAEMEELARAPRLIAALLAGDRTTLEQTAEDELRGVVQTGGEGTGYLFFSGGEVAGTSPGMEEEVVAGARGLVAGPETGDAGRIRYAVFAGVPRQILQMPVVDRVADETVGTLLLISPVIFPPAKRLPDGTELQVGLLLDDQVWGTSLPEPERRALAGRLAGNILSAEFAIQGMPWLAVRRRVAGAGDADLVVVASLQSLRQAQQDLLGRVAGATGTALTAGLVLALVMGKGLSKPISEIGAAAGELEKGNYQVRVKATGKDEIGVLGRRFNEMAAGLALRDQYRRVLDTVADPEVTTELLAGKLDLQGKTQKVGILFCDIRGFTALTEKMAPADVVQMLNAHMSLLTEVAYAHAGTVDKFVGDLIMVTFGAPKTGSDDPRRMARCALAMMAARAKANEGAAVPIRIGIGCAYGPVTAGCMGSTKRMDYTVLGERVNLAARLCGKAPAMKIYIDETLRAELPGAVGHPVPPFEAKGFSAPVQAYELEGLAA